MTSSPPIDRKAFKQFERARFSQVAEAYDQTIAKVTSQVDEALLDAVFGHWLTCKSRQDFSGDRLNLW